MEEKPELEKPSRWIRLYQAGIGVETTVFILGSVLGIATSLLLGFHNLLSVLIMSFGFPKVFWDTVRKLAIQDGLSEEHLDPRS